MLSEWGRKPPLRGDIEQRALGNEGQRHSGERGRVFQVKETRAKALWSSCASPARGTAWRQGCWSRVGGRGWLGMRLEK